eukprot:TRINITY_DN20811_c0_g1_i1.p2 TRINITY_DN20811_c0_g1~~TRINITY_DN20811_c0_g1_i1.p2  ORF type:complete len:232 (+),score=45.55 TRINITY_DN20811_c0_g1_i1:566-1261(+)
MEFVRSATDMRENVRRHQHVSPRPRQQSRALPTDPATSQSALAKQKSAGLHGIDKGEYGAVPRSQPRRLYVRTDDCETEAWCDAGKSHADYMERKSKGQVDSSAWADRGGSHAKTVHGVENRTTSGLHSSWSELAKSKSQHCSPMFAVGEWHGDGRHLASPPYSQRRMRAQINLHTAPARPAICDPLSPQRADMLRADAGERMYSHRAQRAAIRSHQHSIERDAGVEGAEG